MARLFGLFRAQKRAAVDNSFERLPIFHQALLFPFPLSWPIEPLRREAEGGKFLLEFAPEGQETADRKEKLTIQGFNGANDDAGLSARRLLAMMREEMQRLDGRTFHYEELFCQTESGREKIAAVMGLRAHPAEAENAQAGLYMLLEGEHDICIVQRSWKGKPSGKEGLPMQRDELEGWLADFKKIALLENQGMPQEFQP